MNKKLTVIIPARKGSQRVKGKNRRPFCGSSLLVKKIEMIQSLDNVNRIIFDSDCDEMIAIAKSHGLETKKREPYFASSACTNSDYHEYLAKSVDCEHLMVAQVTAPLISKTTYIDCINKYFDTPHDSLMSVEPVKAHLWLNGKPLNYAVGAAPNSQDLPPIVKLTFGVVIAERKIMEQRRNMVGYNPLFYELNEIEALDIDTEFDFEICEYFYNKIYQ